MKNEADHTEVEEVQQVIGAPPPWLLQWGISIIFVVVALLIFLSWKISYPDRIEAAVQITTADPPLRIVARSQGVLEQLFVKQYEKVEAGQLLAILKSNVQWEAVQELENGITTHR